jgi:serine/threonine protein kinase
MISVRVQKGDLLAGKYRIDDVIGEGAMGVVVSAWHIDLEQRVAIKFLNPVLAQREDAVERFLREGRAVVRIESEHVARVLDVGRLEGAEPYLVMEYLEGQDLAAALQQRGALPIVEAVTYLQQACEAIAEAHAVGVVHRDLKPANLFLVDRGAEGYRVKVLDFGISKSLATVERATLTNTSVVMGSPLYMSPEQLRSTRDVDEKADIWALGVILYEMLTRREPFVAATLPQLCALILEASPTPLRSVRPEIPVALERVVLQCLEKAPSARFSSVAELSLAVAPFGSSSAVASAERAARSLRRTGPRLGLGPDQKSSAPPLSISQAQMPEPPSRKRLWPIAALALGAALIGGVLLRGCNARRVGPSAAASSTDTAIESTTMSSASGLPLAREKLANEQPAVTASVEPIGPTPVLPGVTVSALPAARHTPISASLPKSSPPVPTTRAVVLEPVANSQRAKTEPRADNFGGRD